MSLLIFLGDAFWVLVVLFFAQKSFALPGGGPAAVSPCEGYLGGALQLAERRGALLTQYIYKLTPRLLEKLNSDAHGALRLRAYFESQGFITSVRFEDKLDVDDLNLFLEDQSLKVLDLDDPLGLEILSSEKLKDLMLEYQLGVRVAHIPFISPSQVLPLLSSQDQNEGAIAYFLNYGNIYSFLDARSQDQLIEQVFKITEDQSQAVKIRADAILVLIRIKCKVRDRARKEEINKKAHALVVLASLDQTQAALMPRARILESSSPDQAQPPR